MNIRANSHGSSGLRAKVMQEPTVIEAKYGPCIITKVRILQNGEDVAIFSKLGDPIASSKTKGQHVLITKNAKGKYAFLPEAGTPAPVGASRAVLVDDEVTNGNSNGSPSNTLPTQRYSQHPSAKHEQQNRNGHSAPSNTYEDIEEGLDLPEPMSDADKVRLGKLIRERARLMTFCIKVMRNELNHKGLEFHEGSLRSLAVSLFIHISRHLD